MPTASAPNQVTLVGPESIGSLVRECNSSITPIVDYGISHQGLGNPPREGHIRFSQKAPTPNAVIEHYDRDFTVRASGGATMEDIQAALAKQKQFLPLDADPDITLGEVITHNVYGPLRVGYGALRDLLLGLGFIDGTGRDIRVGGRTVKNVAGYDMTRLMVGSLGELGIVHEATLRTYAVPELVLSVKLKVLDIAALDGLIPGWLLSSAVPASLQLLARPGIDGWVLEAAFFGRMNAASAQLLALQTLVDKNRSVQIVDTFRRTLVEEREASVVRRRWKRSAAALVKVVVQPGVTAKTSAVLKQWRSRADRSLSIDALPAHGRIFVGGDLDAQDAIDLDKIINVLLAQTPGYREWHQRPAGATSILPFAPQQPDWAMLTRIKKTMDERSILNPGRLIVVG